MIVVGGGLAGCEAAWQAAKLGEKVKLYEMKPHKFSAAHQMDGLCELVCSNSLKGLSVDNANGLLKEEMRRMGSLLISCADKTSVPAGGALAVDRELFSQMVTKMIEDEPLIEIVREELTKIPDNETVIIATGPLSEGAIAEEITRLTGMGYLSFYDAAAPIIERETIDMTKAYFAARYDKGTPDYINCPMDKEEYYIFYNELVNAETAIIHEVDKPKVFEGCMPVEIMAKRGEQTLLFGPLKPVGLRDPNTGKEAFSVVQLRQDNKEGSIYNMVGFQTNLKWGEQKRVFSLIPALKNAEFLRYGVMHRNSYINSPKLLNGEFRLLSNPKIYFAGQITGVEGYVESAASGMMAGISAARALQNKESIILPKETMLGALSDYISNASIGEFQPMNANFGIIAPLNERIRAKKDRYSKLAERSLAIIDKIVKSACNN